MFCERGVYFSFVFIRLTSAKQLNMHALGLTQGWLEP